MMTKIKIEIKKKKSDEKIEHSLITIRNENKYFSTRPEFFKIPPFTGERSIE